MRVSLFPPHAQNLPECDINAPIDVNWSSDISHNGPIVTTPNRNILLYFFNLYSNYTSSEKIFYYHFYNSEALNNDRALKQWEILTHTIKGFSFGPQFPPLSLQHI